MRAPDRYDVGEPVTHTTMKMMTSRINNYDGHGDGTPSPYDTPCPMDQRYRLFFLTTAALDAGGWAVITVVTTDTVVAGEPVTVTYAARQHGQTLLNGLQGQIEVRLGETVIHVTATALSENGHYAAALTLPRGGTWTLDIESGFHGSAGRAAIRAIEPGSSVPALSREYAGSDCSCQRAARGVTSRAGHPLRGSTPRDTRRAF